MGPGIRDQGLKMWDLRSKTWDSYYVWELRTVTQDTESGTLMVGETSEPTETSLVEPENREL